MPTLRTCCEPLPALSFIQVKPEPSSSKTFDYLPFFAYTPNGTVKGDLVYINRGYPMDIKFLLSHNVSLENKVVIARGLGASVSTNLICSCSTNLL